MAKKKATFDPNAAAAPGSGIFGLDCTLEESQIVLVPVPWDPTTSYRRGAANGPAAILEASYQVEPYDITFGRIYECGIYLLPTSKEIVRLNASTRPEADKIIARGGIIGKSKPLHKALAAVNTAGRRLNEIVYRQTREQLEAGKIVGIIGGDHSSPYGAIRAVCERYPKLGIFHLDAHADLRKAYEGFTHSHASIMYNVMHTLPEVVHLSQVGIRDLCEEEHQLIQNSDGRIKPWYDRELARLRARGCSWQDICNEIVQPLPDDIWMSCDIDGYDPKLCPGTGTPVPGGLSWNDMFILIETILFKGKNIVGFDVNEVSPRPGDEWDGNVGARLTYLLAGATLKSKRRLRS